MGSFKLGKMTLRSLFTKPETLLYPTEVKPAYLNLKGHIANRIDECILCGMCQRVCPSDAIVVEKKNGTWSIDHFRCVQCSACVRACPTSSLSMEPEYQKPLRMMHIELMEKPEESAEEKAAKAAAKKAKVEAAMKAKQRNTSTD
ncbi:NADH:ubiquinone oxidoreductase chain I-like protein [Cryptobacterium curtum DSM 15641]|uniref:NADH:ubiquinone oxidoreductase chain I-like protein n=1 Tax=Cryptobacterium curtum (strain ATCC 700683 / DSM 15641 / CCUG 43107 / 12-3) TaxID=469378 RepID=C7MNE3_CRYCD|nr:4Fe-4S dicluster domain-containing protein [Cryptobacterium curtum]ACU94433.1 NADH:ubiquinone oxidoreductase chain I-like protein [Cryptobacterium curtum DSM 15641]